MASLNERLSEARASLQTIALRHNFREQKLIETRVYLLEEHVAMIAVAIQTLLEAHEKGVL